MKIVCPHCRQETPNVPEEYLNMEIECPACHKAFVCEKPKFCSECGAANPAKAPSCIQCGTAFTVPPPTPLPTPIPPPIPSAPGFANPPAPLPPPPAAAQQSDSLGILLGKLSLASGLISFVCLPWIYGPAAIILGLIALHRKNESGMTGLILGIIGTVLSTILVIIGICRG